MNAPLHSTTGRPPDAGLYSFRHEHDSCGVALIVDLKGRKSHDIVEKALMALEHLEHRGGCGCEDNTGDGAGILMQIPHEFYVREMAALKVALPEEGTYGTGVVFLPQAQDQQKAAVAFLEETVRSQNQVILGWRNLPVDDTMIGSTAREPMPVMRQVFIGLGPLGTGLPGAGEEVFERRLFIIRKAFENSIRAAKIENKSQVYLPSLSCRTIIYKGMLISHQLRPFFKDLHDPLVKSAIGMVHSRFSTNTFPKWDLAQPFRYLCHNGEINTLRGNINWMRAREAVMASSLFADELHKIIPTVNEENSDSATFDNVLELLVMGGYSLPHAIMMMIPEAWGGHESMSQEKKDFYQFHSCLMEPWDGPASIAFTDGRVIGAVLDRNGLRPSRYYVTKDDLVIMASEVGVLDGIAPESVLVKGRLQPGRMFLIDTGEGRIIDDAEIKNQLATQKPYAQWLKENLVALTDLPEVAHLPEPDHATVMLRQKIFGYTQEDIDILLPPMAVDGVEAIGSMGTDTPLAVLSEKSQSLFSYFKQLFAQVTNPPLDAIREELVTSVETSIGPEGNLLQAGPASCAHIKLGNPILDNDELGRLKNLENKPYRHFKAHTLSILFNDDGKSSSLKEALESLFRAASLAITKGCNILILSDRGVDEAHVPIPSLLAVAGLHHHLVREGTRARVGLVLESGEPREVHHFALLVGYGAGAINPYLAFESLDDMIRSRIIKNIDHKKAVYNYIKAVRKGVVKVMSKMGISTIQSYRGAQIFEAIGLNSEVIDTYFTGTASRIQGVGLDILYQETRSRHRKAFPKRYKGVVALDPGGEYQWRRDGQYHLFNPDTIAKLQQATSSNNFAVFKQYSSLVNQQSEHLCTLRGLMQFKKSTPILLSEVESVENIIRRFKTGAMSYGSISAEAHETLAIAMNRIGGKSNTGEGGEDTRRFQPDANGDLRRSAIKQVASGRFGVTSEYLTSADEIQIKMAQGAKPGEGGQLPGKKVWPWIAKVRYSTPNVGLISPPPHHDIYSIEDLAQLIFDLKNANPKAGISVKLVAEVGVGTVAAGVAKAKADLVLISGHDGGTGASPLTSLKYAGVPWELGLSETQQTLVNNNLRDRIRVEVDGQLKTGRDVVIGALLGGEEFGFATAPLVVLGCIMMRACHLDTCPVGIATQNPRLREKFAGNASHVVNFFRFIAEEVREIMAELGFRTIDDMVGRVDLLDVNPAIAHYKARGVDLGAIFHRPLMAQYVVTHRVRAQDHGLEKVLDNKLIELSSNAITEKKPVSFVLPITNRDRATGTMLGHAITQKQGGQGLPDDTIRIKFTGSAGQSFGAFLPRGVTMMLEGDANDYVGKGLSGGRLILYPDRKSSFVAEQNILIGNVVLYGATSGEGYFRGIAGERFAVRNSGALAVVEGVGDHGCEYMTGGRVVILGRTGRNFAAGMSGGIAYVYDTEKSFAAHCNLEMVGLDTPLDDEDVKLLTRLITHHADYTGSVPAKMILKNFERELKNFIKVLPHDFKQALIAVRRKMQELGISEREAMYG